MKATKMIVLVAMVAVLAGAGLAGAGDWQKLGGKTIAFKDEASTFTVETKDAPVGGIKLKVGGSWVRFTNLKLNFGDGTSQTVTDRIDVEPGLTSEAIAIEGGPKTLSSIEITCSSAASARGGRATIAVLGS
jgi:hypothetical protein